ncbi:MAG: alpha/beta fold hydrolase [Desulfobacteraceae bacterium]|nr:MAG: alpha/beta fold hydrolase [Desulfobacteraceae bacterium]
MKVVKKLQDASKSMMRFVVNGIPTNLVNAGYNTYSKIYKGQISLGLPVSKELVVSQEEIRNSAVGKLALALYHIILRATDIRIPRDQIKLVILDELAKQRLRMTENVILLNQIDLNYIVQQRFKIPKSYLPNILTEAGRRRILKESLRTDRMPAYFESEIEELEQNGRGNYEIVYYRDFTEEGKEIGFRRLVSMEDVTANDNRPALTLVPGFANNSNCFNINNRYSMAKDLADMGFWVYLFDPRGVGVNEGRFDPYYTIDTMIDYDLATVVRFIHARSHGKPTILLGHSMGGVVSENMILNWALREHLDEVHILTEKQKSILNQTLPPLVETEQYLKTVRGVISLGSPKFFNRKSHLFFPIALWLNHISRIFRLKHVPVQEISKVMTELPLLKDFVRILSNHNIGDLNFLISPENHLDDKHFVERYLQVATESIPLGLGFQCLKAVYDGKGFKRMDDSRLNYSELSFLFPDNIPVFHFWGTADHLASVDNLKYSELYPHQYKQTYHIKSVQDLKKIEIPQEQSLLIDFVIEGANHIDLLYGKAARDYINPIIMQIVEKVWGDWAYDTEFAKTA